MIEIKVSKVLHIKATSNLRRI